MSYLNQFDKAVEDHCGRLSVAERAKTGYYRKSDMDRAYQELYKNPRIQSRFGGGVSKMKQSPEGVFNSSLGHGSAVGDILPVRFGARRFNLGSSVGSMSMFGDTSSEAGEVDMSDDSLDSRSGRFRRAGLTMADIESQISADNSYWDRDSVQMGFPTQSEFDADMEREQQYAMEREREQEDAFLYDTLEVRAEDRLIRDVPRLRNIQDRGLMDVQMRTQLWTYRDEPQGRTELLTGLPPSRLPTAQPYPSAMPPMTLEQMSVPQQAVPMADAINTQPRARM